MRLTTEMLKAYVGGQMEIQNKNEGYMFRGQIKKIEVKDNAVVAVFDWLAKGKDYPPLPKGWVNDPSNLDYSASLEIYSVSDIGPSGDEVGGGNRICLNSPIVGEMVVIFPPDGSRLDPSKVEGLVLGDEKVAVG